MLILEVAKGARTKMDNYKGIPVKDAFYTAGYEFGSTERYVGPVNHTETIVLDGPSIGLANADILLLTGNRLAKIPAEAFAIEKSTEKGKFISYDVVNLHPFHRTGVLGGLGLLKEDELASLDPEIHNARMRDILKALEKFVPTDKIPIYKLVKNKE